MDNKRNGNKKYVMIVTSEDDRYNPNAPCLKLCKKDSEEKVIVEKIKPYSEWIKYVRKKGAKV